MELKVISIESLLGVEAMTWVVGASTPFGYGAVISDIQVSNDEGLREDVLQKVYPVSRCIVAGFAGDILPGFFLVDSLRDFLKSPLPATDGCWDPQWVADNWPEEARRVYRQIKEEYRPDGTDILMLGLEDARNSKPRIMGDAIGHLSVFRSPNFVPKSKQGGRKAMSIGCGNGVEKYTTTLEELMLDDDGSYMQAEVYNPGGYGRRIAENLAWIAKQNPEDGISEHFQLFIVRMGGLTHWDPPGVSKLARSWPDLLQMLRDDMDPQSLAANGSRRRYELSD